MKWYHHARLFCLVIRPYILQIFLLMFEEALRTKIKKHIINLPKPISKEQIAKSIIKRVLLSKNCSYYIRHIVQKLRKQQNMCQIQKQSSQRIIFKEEVYQYLKRLIWNLYRQINKNASNNILQQTNIDQTKGNYDENTRPFPLDNKQQTQKSDFKKSLNEQSENVHKNQHFPRNNIENWFGQALLQNNSYCYYGHLLYGDKIWSILNYHYLENESIEHQKVLIVWKQRKNGTVPLSTLLSISDLLYFRPKILSDIDINISFQIREKIEKIRILSSNKSS